MPQLLAESLDAAARERAHQHIESCAACFGEWQGMREAWDLLEQLPVVEPPPSLRERVMAAAGPRRQAPGVVPFPRRRAVR
ncbi:MAG TPA: hypothetical protein VNL91_09425, partial [Thermoanaerobaculia bacterium]|nr:hypothetical protein [Thermoanaerobaculia bacterium]